MGILSVASSNSCYKGLDYYKNNKVIKINKINDNEYYGIVKGTNNYHVYLNILHPRKSTCDCPFANGKRIICKHIVATYFKALPQEAINYEEEQKRLEKEYENKCDEEYEKVVKYINHMSKKELVDELINILDVGPEWLYDDFLNRNLY